MTTRTRGFVVALAAMGCLGLAASPAQGQRACQENFTESGEWSSGKSFQTFVVAQGATLDQAFLTVARTVASEGFLGVTSSKDVGMVSAYQEDNGKKSPITVMVSEQEAGGVKVEVTFKLAKGLRAPAAATRAYLCKVAESVLSESEKASSGPGAPSISLRAGAEEVPLPVVAGQFRQAGGGPVLLLFFDFEGARAEARTGDRRPSLLVRAQHDPAKSYVLVRCDADQEDDRRSVKAGSAGTLLKMGVTGKGDLRPDKDWTRPFSTTAEGEGVWRLVPSSDLEPGEYGLWDIQGYGVALFGID